jgi:thioredoxin reductase (NADPH)
MLYDAIIVGAGPTGLACGIELTKRGLSSLLIEKGCVVNSLYNYPTNMVFFTTPELLEIGGLPMTSLNEKPNRTEALKYYRRCADYFKLNVRQYERVAHVAGTDGAFSVETDKSSYTSRKVILATGYYDIPNRLHAPGEDLDKVLHYYKEPHPYYGHDVLVIGAKNSASIAALELWWTGARVTMVHRGDAIHRNVKYWIKPNIENRIASGEIPMHFRSHVTEIRPHEVDLMTPDGPKTIKNDFVFAMTGYRPDFEFLASCGVHINADSGRPVVNPETYESQRAGVYLAGVIVAGVHTSEVFIENGRFHGQAIAADIERTLSPRN